MAERGINLRSIAVWLGAQTMFARAFVTSPLRSAPDETAMLRRLERNYKNSHFCKTLNCNYHFRESNTETLIMMTELIKNFIETLGMHF